MGSMIEEEDKILNQAIEDHLEENHEIINIQKVEGPRYNYRFYIYTKKKKDMLGKKLIQKAAFIIPNMKEEIKKIIEEDRDSKLVLTNETYDSMTFSIKVNEDEESTSTVSFDDAWRMSKILLMEFTGKIKASIEEDDNEWVYLNIEFV